MTTAFKEQQQCDYVALNTNEAPSMTTASTKGSVADAVGQCRARKRGVRLEVTCQVTQVRQG